MRAGRTRRRRRRRRRRGCWCERALRDGEPQKTRLGHVAFGLVVHRVQSFVLLVERLRPHRLHALDGPRIIVAERQKERVELERLGPTALVDHPHEEHGPLRRRVVDEQRARQVGGVADDHGLRVVALAHDVGEALEAGGQARLPLVVAQHGRHAEDGVLVHGGGRAREQQVQVVLRAVEEHVPEVLRRRVLGQFDRDGGQHAEVQRGLAYVLRLVRTPHVHVARDACEARVRRVELAPSRAEEAHAAHAARAGRGQVARLAVALVRHACSERQIRRAVTHAGPTKLQSCPFVTCNVCAVAFRTLTRPWTRPF